MLLHPGEPYDFDGERRTYPARPARPLGGRQPVPPPSGPQPAAPRARAARHDRRPRAVLDRPGAPCRRRPPRDHDARARRHRGRPQRPLPRRHARAVDPPGEARSDHAILADLADRLGAGEAFTEGRGERAWLAHLYDRLAGRLARQGVQAPDFDTFWTQGSLRATRARRRPGAARRLPRRPGCAPAAHARAGASSSIPRRWRPSATTTPRPCRVAGAHRVASLPARPALPAAADRQQPGAAPAQPARRRRPQPGGKVQGREPIRLNPEDAAARGIADGDVVRVFNDRGELPGRRRPRRRACAGRRTALHRGVVRPRDPAAERPLCVHGNVNVLTRDAGTSRLAQGCTGQHALVDVARHEGALPPIRAFDPPA